MPPPPLRIPLSLNMADFEKNLESARSLTSTATQFIVKRFVDVNASALAAGGAAGSAALGMRALLGAAAPLAVAISGIVGVFNLMSYATELAKERIEEFNAIADKADKAGVSTDFFQRLTKSGQQLKLTVDDVNEALERFNGLSKDKLGGSDLSKQVERLSGFGNFQGNSGVGALAGATGTEDKLRAAVSLINQALESGQRLAALDIAEKAFGSKVADNLRQDSNYLNQMLQTADKIKATELISQEQVGQAIELKNRMEEAQKVLADKFKPIQDDLAKLGVNYHESWIGIVEVMSSAVTQANYLYDAIKRIPDVMADLGNLPFWSKLTEATGRLGMNSDPKALGLILRGEEGFNASPANAALAAGLRNPAAVRQAMQQATDVQSLVRGDTSQPPPAKPEADGGRDQFEIAIDSITKHIATLNADTAATFQNNAARAQFRAEFQALTAIMRDGGEVTQDQINKYEKLRQSMSAQQALEASGITLTKEHSDAFLNASKNIGAAAGAYDQAREKLNQINSASATLGSALWSAFADAVVEGRNLNEVLDSLVKTLARAGINSIFASIFNAPSSGGASLFASLFSGIGRNAEGTDNWRGGLTWVGEKGPEIVNLPRGAQVVPNAVAARMGGGQTFAPVYQIDAAGADSGTVARIQSVLAAHARAIAGQSRAFASAQRMQATGVG